MRTLILVSIAGVIVCGCGKKSDTAADASAAAAHEIYSPEDVSQALLDANVVIT
jgi:hypothetical protein